MKKILLLVIMFMSFVLPVKAEVYYSNYSEYSSYSTEKVMADDITCVETEFRYKYYHEEIIGDYYLEGMNDKYSNVDKNNTKIVEIEWLFEQPEEVINRKIDTRLVYGVSRVLPIRFIKLSNVHGSDGLKLSEIVVYSNNNKIDYVSICSTCNLEYSDTLKNSNLRDTDFKIENNGELTLDLLNFYDADSIKIEIYIYDHVSSSKSFDISFSRENYSTPYYSYHFEKNFVANISNIYKVDFSKDNMNKGEFEWSSIEFVLDEVEPNEKTIVKEYTQYKITDIYYYYYDISREYSDYYSEYYNQIDKENYTEYYRYRTRDKIIIDDNFKIISKNKTINDLITSTTPYEIEGNIDYNKNGKYKINIITPYKKIEKELIINIPDNDKTEIVSSDNKTNMNNNDNISLYNQYVEKLNDYNVIVGKLNLEIEDYKNMLSIKNDEKNIMQKQYENELLNFKMKEDKENIIIKEETTNVTSYSKKRIYIIIIIIILLIITIASLIYEIKNYN